MHFARRFPTYCFGIVEPDLPEGVDAIVLVDDDRAVPGPDELSIEHHVRSSIGRWLLCLEGVQHGTLIVESKLTHGLSFPRGWPGKATTERRSTTMLCQP